MSNGTAEKPATTLEKSTSKSRKPAGRVTKPTTTKKASKAMLRQVVRSLLRSYCLPTRRVFPKATMRILRNTSLGFSAVIQKALLNSRRGVLPQLPSTINWEQSRHYLRAFSLRSISIYPVIHLRHSRPSAELSIMCVSNSKA